MILTGLMLAFGWFLFDILIIGAGSALALRETHKDIQKETSETVNKFETGSGAWFDKEEALRQKRLRSAGL